MATMEGEALLADAEVRLAETPGRTLALIVLAGAAAIYILGLRAGLPSTLPDEAIYAELARSLGAHGRFEFAGMPFPVLTFGPLYPIALAPIFRLAPTAHDAYLAARAVNALLFASAAVPTWLLARRVVTHKTALIVAAAAVLVPACVYSVKLQTESLAYPLVLWSVLAALRVVERPRLTRQLIVVACVGAAALVRFELLALGPAFALGCLAAGDGRIATRLRRLLPLLGAFAIVGATAAVMLVLTSHGRTGTGTHGFDAHRVSAGGFLRWFIGTLGMLDLYTGILPFAAFVLVAVSATTRRLDGRAGEGARLRHLVVLTAASGLALAAAGSLYLSSIPQQNRPPTPTDRYTFYVVPLILLAFAAWIERGAHRPKSTRWVAAIAGLLPLLVAATEVRGATTIGNTNALGLLPWLYVRAVLPQAWLAVFAAFCCFCALRFARPKGDVHRLLKPVATTLTLTSVCAFFFVVAAAGNLRPSTPVAGWLDAHTDADVVALWVDRPAPSKSFALWEIDLLNRNLKRVYYLKTPDQLAVGFERRLERRADGVLLDRGRPLTWRYVLTTSGTPVAGELLAESKGFALYEVHAPLRLQRQTVGRALAMS
jgi:hypothetical protein